MDSMTPHAIVRAVAGVIQYALVGILFLAIVAFWAIVTQENGSRNLSENPTTWEELVMEAGK